MHDGIVDAASVLHFPGICIFCVHEMYMKTATWDQIKMYCSDLYNASQLAQLKHSWCKRPFVTPSWLRFLLGHQIFTPARDLIWGIASVITVPWLCLQRPEKETWGNDCPHYPSSPDCLACPLWSHQSGPAKSNHSLLRLFGQVEGVLALIRHPNLICDWGWAVSWGHVAPPVWIKVGRLGSSMHQLYRRPVYHFCFAKFQSEKIHQCDEQKRD